MTSKLIGGAAALLMLSAVQASAQTSAHKTPAAAAAPGAAPQITYGAPITGVCVFYGDAALRESTVGKAADTRLAQLRAQASAEVSGEQTALEADIKAFQDKRASLTQDQIQAQGQPLVERREALSQKAQQRERELEYTAQHARARIAQAVNPLVRAVFEERHCSILLSGDAVMATNPAMDITPAVLTRLNATMSTITFDRETPPAQQ
jgi:outer membrane protein